MRCLGKDRNKNECRNHAIGETKFCKFHDYMSNYTNDMIQNTKLCSGCKKMTYLEDNEKTCNKCRERTKNNREKIKATVEIVLCKKEGCKFKQFDERGYCKKHEICLLLEDINLRNKRLCVNYVRGCREELDKEYKKNRCKKCLENDREIDKTRRNKAKEENNNLLQNITEKNCTVCCKSLPINMFERNISDNTAKEKTNFTKTCSNCRQDNKKQDKNRDKEHRNKLARERVYYNYQKWANKRKIAFSLTEDIFQDMIKKPCNYCGIMQECGYNGIDRINSSGIYEIENCTSCCQICNYLKNKDTTETFTQRIEHILTHNKLIDGKLYPQLFSNHTKVSYSIYKNSAKFRSKEFKLTDEEFKNTIKNNCYICGKSPNINHRNGIDRFDNSIGYLIDNCRACCHTCNFTKNDYSFQDMLRKMIMINKYTKK